MDLSNEVTIIMESKSCNESFARITAAAFVSGLDPTINDITEIKTAVSEAVTNAIIHGYECAGGKITLRMRIVEIGDCREVIIEVADDGMGIPDITAARKPLYTTKPEMERSGMGFTVMETFMDELEINSRPGEGTQVIMKKKFPLI